MLVIDEIGYLSYDARYADLLFEVVSRRYQQQRPIVLTTNKPFGEWNQVFPNAACVVTLVDRLVHNAEILSIEGEVLSPQRGQRTNRATPHTKISPTRKARSHRALITIFTRFGNPC